MADIDNFENLSYLNVRSNRANIGTDINGTITFDIGLSSNINIEQLKNSFFTMRMNISMPGNGIDISNGVGGVLPTNITNMSLAQNVCAALISSSNILLNDVQCENIENYDVVSTSEKYLTSSLILEQNSGSPLIPYTDDRIPTSINQGILPQSDPPVFSHLPDVYLARRKINSSLIHSCNGNSTVMKLNSSFTITDIDCLFSFNCPFFQTSSDDAFMYNNNKISINFQLNSNFKKDMFQGITATTNTSNYVFNIKTFEWVIPTYKSSIPQSISQNIDFVSTYSYKTLHTNSIYTLNVPASTHQIGIYFSHTRNSNFLNSETNGQLDCISAAGGSFLTDANILSPICKTLYINLNNTNYPQNSYMFVTGSSELHSADIRRSYETYKRLSLSYSQNEAPLLSYDAYLRSPFFLFSCRSSLNTQAGGTSQLTIYTSDPANALFTGLTSTMNVVAYFDKRVSTSYTESGNVENTSVMIAA